MTNGERAIKIQHLKEEIRSLSRQLNDLIHECKHEIVCHDCESDPNSENCDEWGHGTAICTICKVQFGWFCPDSGTGQCEYDEHEWCLHCGEPDERK